MTSLSASNLPVAKPSRAISLLRKVIATPQVDRTTLAGALAVTPEMIHEHASGREPMSLDAQQRLATFVIERVPSLVRLGYRLRGQATAAFDFQRGRTATHNTSPPGR